MKLKDYEVTGSNFSTDMLVDKVSKYSGVVLGGDFLAISASKVSGECISLRVTHKENSVDIARVGINLTRNELQELVNELQEVLDQ